METWELSLLRDNSSLRPSPRDSHATFAWKNKLYVFGGSAANIKLNDLWEFEIERKLWREVRAIGPAPINREAHTVTVIPDNSALIFGGKGPTKRLADGYLLTFKTSAIIWNTCTQLGQIPCARDGHCMHNIGNKVYLFGGENDKRQILNDFYVGVVEPETCTLTWKRCEQKNAPRARRAATLSSYMDECLVLIGGEGYEEVVTITLNDVWIYNISNEIWEELFTTLRINTGDWFSPRAYHSTITIEDCFCVFGGIYEPGKALDDLYVLTLTGDIPKCFERLQNIGMIDVKEEHTTASNISKPQFFTQYIQNRPFNPPAREEPELLKTCGMMISYGVSCSFPNERVNEWAIGAFGDIFNVVEDLTSTKVLSINFLQHKIIEENKHETIHSSEKLPTIEIIIEGAIISVDSFRDILNYFGKREEQRVSPDFGLLKFSLMSIGSTLLIVNKMSESAYVGLISTEYMNLANNGLYHCPYVKLSMDKGKLTGDSNTLAMLNDIFKYSHIPFESNEDFLNHIQSANDQIIFFISKLKDSIKSYNNDIMHSSNMVREELVDFSLRSYLKYWNLTHKLKIFINEKEIKEENPYVKVEKYVEDKKMNKYFKRIDNLYDKSIGGTLFLFHKNLLIDQNLIEPEALNGILLYYNNMLEVRLVGQQLGDYIGISRKLIKNKKSLFDWGGYVKFTKGTREEIMNPSFLCSLEKKIAEAMHEVMS